MQGYERLYRVSADLAHELRNPLASISAAVQFLKEGKKSSDFIEMLVSETTRLNNLVNDFLMFSRPSDAPVEVVDLSEMMKIIVARHKNGKAISENIEDGILIDANRTFIDVALTNIVKNAMEAARSAVFISLGDASSDSVAGGKKEVVLNVEDDGYGIDEAIKERIFEPFFTTKHNGTGLGLAIAYRVITGFGGYIIAGKSSHGGAKFTIVMQHENRKNEKEGRRS
jgi:signal transduction histidine kinase